MAVRPSTKRGRVFKFAGKDLDPDILLVARIDGQERISRPYRFDIELISSKSDLDLAKILHQPVFLGMKVGKEIEGGNNRGVVNLKIHGMLASFEQRSKELGWVVYRAGLVPRLWRLSLTEASRVFLDKSTPEIVEELLKNAGFTTEDYELRIDAAKYVKHEYVVQYGESDLDFIARRLEHEGIYYFFEQGDEGEIVVFSDSPDGPAPMEGDETLAYKPSGHRGSGATVPEWYEPEVVDSLVCRLSQVPGKLLLQDYNHQSPAVDIRTPETKVSEQGECTFYEYGNHYKDEAGGKALADIRAKELKCREQIFLGTSDAKSMRAGALFELKDHYRSEFDQKYLLTEVTHCAEVSMTADPLAAPITTYRNDFVAIPADVRFCPPRETPKPRIPGTITAKVDAPGDGKYAEVDDQGRYKVRLPFDLSGRKDGKASHAIRMAQPYVGAGYGMHFPLHKGTEVMISHELGDPDRPYIAAAVPDPERASEITGENHTECVLRSAGNNVLLLDDLEGKERLFLHAQKDEEIRVKNDTYEWVGNERHLTVEKDQIELIKNDRKEKIERDHVQAVGGNAHLTVEGDRAVDIGGKLSLAVDGDVAEAFSAGHCEETKGSYYLKATHIVIEAMAGITLKVAGSSVVIDPVGVSVMGPMVNLFGGAVLIMCAPGSPPAIGIPIPCDTPELPSPPKEPGESEVGSAGVAGAKETKLDGSVVAGAGGANRRRGG